MRPVGIPFVMGPPLPRSCGIRPLSSILFAIEMRLQLCTCSNRSKCRSVSPSWYHASGIFPPRYRPPASSCYDCPHCLNQSEGPSALEKTVDRTKSARKSKGQDEPRTPLFVGVADEHRRHRKETECCKRTHRGAFRIAAMITDTFPPSRDSFDGPKAVRS